jgi:uncharacterized protein YjbJ (UPF0337 family)
LFQFNPELNHALSIQSRYTEINHIFMLNGDTMDWEQVESNWDVFKGKIKQNWTEISNEQLDMIEGSRERLRRIIQRTYGINEPQAEAQLQDWQSLQINIDGHFYEANRPNSTRACN